MKKYLFSTVTVFLIAVAAVVIGPRMNRIQSTDRDVSNGTTPSLTTADASEPRIDCCSIIRIPHVGNEEIDNQIRQWQSRLTNRMPIESVIEKLGWLFVAKARVTSDAGFYKVAEQAALCLDKLSPESPESLLLRGHVLQNLHQFHRAKPFAEKLVEKRGIAADLGLLGDVCLEMGEVDRAIEVYQRMMDLQPGPQAYMRGAHVRWLTGDLAGALELQKKAIQAGGQDREASAWAYARLAQLQLIAGELADAKSSCEAALVLHPKSAHAHGVLGRIHLSQGDWDAAITEARASDVILSLPEAQWTLLEAFRRAGRLAEAEEVRAQLRNVGESQDRRTFALFLASENLEREKALELAKNELTERADVHTHDVLAWAYFKNGELDSATHHSQQAMRLKTVDPRLFFHSAVIAAKRGESELAQQYGRVALDHLTALLPSEIDQLVEALANDQANLQVQRSTGSDER